MDGLYKFILIFGKAYNNLTEIEKKELANKFIDKIEIIPEEKEDGSVIKSITLRFPIYLGKKVADTIGVSGQTTDKLVETVCLMERTL